ncbi:ScbR family autoregulator-binding transcription factor [Streptomyces fulvorobeus]|uniref:AcrR family transcriptional regulator n=1 Tax=Streptomyces fulvorobeus TaxID=284028 RepID=A0A7Y9HC44_9ACTN|nr:ScbR family autoregulator-binding transcription factor [Streptomyces fulvorobeus]NYE41708.1 AcrR family transcriptional regulator [Streptomyces fulvorobeus]
MRGRVQAARRAPPVPTSLNHALGAFRMAKQDRAVRTREELIRSAAESFGRSGFGLSSLSGISAGAGVSSGALHFHFASKRELGEAVEEAAARTLGVIIAPCPPSHPDPLRVLVDTSHLLARRITQDVVLRAAFGLGNDATWQGGGTLWQEWRRWVRATLTLAGERGHLAADVLPDAAVSAVTAAVVGSDILGRADAEWSSCRALTQFWSLMLPRLAVRGGDAGLPEPVSNCPATLRP